MNDLTEEWVIKVENDFRVVIREPQITEQSCGNPASAFANQTLGPSCVLKVFNWNVWAAESTFRREELYFDECK